MTVMKLLIVESPTKAKTLNRFLGRGYEVVATMGHLRDLPKSKIGIDVNDNFTPQYVVDPKKKDRVKEIVKLAKKSEVIVLATDPDREGEAIAWHVQGILEEAGLGKKNKRAVFHEITKKAVEEALEHTREINQDLVNAQQGRRILDRLVGYKLSPLLWKKIRTGLSAGRVQSVAVRLVTEREKERQLFVVEKYYQLVGVAKDTFKAELVRWEGKKVTVFVKHKLFDGEYRVGKTLFTDKNTTKAVCAQLGQTAIVQKVEGKERKRYPLPPFTTSKLQQSAARKFGWSGKKTMRMAQNLYEQGFITYHRTDSLFLAEEAIKTMREKIAKTYGNEYVSDKERRYKTKAKLAQEAHEAIRPTDVEKIEVDGRDEGKLYQLIWARAMASQAAPAILNQTKIVLVEGDGEFEARGVKMRFPGFLAITGEKGEEQLLPDIKVGDKVKWQKLEQLEQETSPPPRYNEASLVAALERQGIGRPSTYAPTLSLIQQRQYVEKEEGRFVPTALGTTVVEFLAKNFTDIVDLPFTASMEEGLDEIARGELVWKDLLAQFWGDFEPKLKSVDQTAERMAIPVEETGQACPKCNIGQLVIRVGRFGKFKACNKFPECRHTEPLVEKLNFACPECGGEAVTRRSKKGRKFFGCANYPKCKWASWKKPA